MRVHVVLAGGGTAGHVEPALATADALRRLAPDAQITFLGTASGLEARLVPERGGRLVLVPRVPLPRRPTPDILTVPFRLRAAVRAVERILLDASADVVVGFGGYVAMPAYLAARAARTPIVVHESNVRPGLANRIGARFATAVATGYPDSGLPGARYLGTPLRTAISGLDRAAARPAAAATFGLDPALPTVLIFGGSQGARSINTAAVAAAPRFAAAGVQVLHAAGATHADAIRADLAAQSPRAQGRTYQGPTYQVLAYIDQMELAYAAADVAVCRAGAMTCTELAAVGLPALYVPLPHGNGEQRLNAMPVVDAGGGRLIADADLTGEAMASEVLSLVQGGQLAAMSMAAARFGRRDGDTALAQLILDIGGGAR